MRLTTLADAVDLARLPPSFLKLSRMEINIMEIPKTNDPHIIGFRRPIRSKKNVG